MKIIVDILKQDYIYITKKHCLPSCDERTLRNSYYEMILKSVPLGLSEEKQLKTGYWVKEKSLHGWDGKSYQCSECGRSIHLDLEVEELNDYLYCHCGAKMIESE